MPIVTISMSESDLKEIEELQKFSGFTSRSELLRHAVQALIAERETLEQLSGEITAIVIVIYSDKGKSNNCDAVQHTFGHLLTTTMHSHSKSGVCVDVILVQGYAVEAREFVRRMRTQRSVIRVMVIPVGRD